MIPTKWIIRTWEEITMKGWCSIHMCRYYGFSKQNVCSEYCLEDLYINLKKYMYWIAVVSLPRSRILYNNLKQKLIVIHYFFCGMYYLIRQPESPSSFR